MPGLVGSVRATPDTSLPSVFDRLMAPMLRGGRLQHEKKVATDGRWALGRVHLGVLQPDPQLTSDGQVQVLFHGDLENLQELSRALATNGHPASRPTACSVVAAWYQHEGMAVRTRLKGAFTAVILDQAQRKLLLINDLLGTYPLYWWTGPEGLTFASELKAVLRDAHASRALDPRAVADYIHFGFVFADRTLARDVRLLPPATTLEYDWATGDAKLERRRRISDLFQPDPGGGTPDDPLASLSNTFRQAVERTEAGDHRFGLSLSGGLDTRAILSALDTERRPIATYTLGIDGCADQVIADRLAKTAGTSHRFFELDSRYLSEFLANLTRMVSLTDGLYLSHGLTEMLALEFLKECDFTVLLRGHCGEMAKSTLAWPFHVDATVQTLNDTRALIPYLLKRTNYVGHGVDGLFRDGWASAVQDGGERSLTESLAEVPLSPADACSYLYLAEQHRRYTVASLEIFRNVVEVRLPFADEAFLTELLSLPMPLRSDTTIHKRLMRPALLRVRNSNTGAPAGAGPLVEYGLDKLNTILKRLNVYGYRHYHNFDAWMRQQLLATVETVLLDPATIRRGIVDEGVLRRLIAATREGTADHGYLFQVLLVLELWQRENTL